MQEPLEDPPPIHWPAEAAPGAWCHGNEAESARAPVGWGGLDAKLTVVRGNWAAENKAGQSRTPTGLCWGPRVATPALGLLEQSTDLSHYCQSEMLWQGTVSSGAGGSTTGLGRGG